MSGKAVCFQQLRRVEKKGEEKKETISVFEAKSRSGVRPRPASVLHHANIAKRRLQLEMHHTRF